MFSTLISTSQLAAHLDDPDWLIFDVRHDLAAPPWGRRVYDESHIPHALFVSLDNDLSATPTGKNGRHPLPSPAQCAERLARFGVAQGKNPENAPGKQIAAYDQGSGMFAARLWWVLRWLGFDRCAVLDGGWAQWLAEGQPVSTAQETPQPASFVPRPQDLTVDAGEVLANLSSPILTLIDARAASRYRGEEEPIDPVGGHIPGALNRPYTDNLSAGGTFKSAAQLRAEFNALLGDTPAARVVHQCGSGVTACHNVLAMEIAGLTGSHLYPGSWSEWCSDPARPMAKG
ncbi:MAG: sulfurtransferase [Burkholderiales bacterium]|jgi:thiosulfate/3-mercaptopyruvate sulfurtransferase|nr:sulfurtransferase [Burkholderiales bacterium]